MRSHTLKKRIKIVLPKINKLETMGIYLLITLLNLLIGTGYCLVNSLDDYHLNYVLISQLILIPISVLLGVFIKNDKLK
jgi:hypothetical protein